MEFLQSTDFFSVWFQGLGVILVFMTLLWLASILLRNASIVDIFWGSGFVLVHSYYLLGTGEVSPRDLVLSMMVTLWGFRLSLYLGWRNFGKGEDFRYKAFRDHYGPKRYWWVSFFQVFMLQGVLLWLVSVTLMGALTDPDPGRLHILDIAGIVVWLTGFLFESVGDLQMARFRSRPENRGKVMDRGLWRLTRHPNYFGDAAVWWGYGLLCIAAGSWMLCAGSLLMTWLIVRVSGVRMLERTLVEAKAGYREYAARTSAFFPWFPKKQSKQA